MEEDVDPPSRYLKASLCRANMSQREAARVLGISPQYLHDVIANRRRLTPALASAWAEKIEPAGKEAFRSFLHLIGAESEGWDIDALLTLLSEATDIIGDYEARMALESECVTATDSESHAVKYGFDQAAIRAREWLSKSQGVGILEQKGV